MVTAAIASANTISRRVKMRVIVVAVIVTELIEPDLSIVAFVTLHDKQTSVGDGREFAQDHLSAMATLAVPTTKMDET